MYAGKISSGDRMVIYVNFFFFKQKTAYEIPLRDAIAKGMLAGPRILTAVEPLFGQGEKTGTPEEIRAYVRKKKEAGADVIKIFASQSIRQGGGMTLSQEQLNAACDEAKKLGLRTLVHGFKV